MNLRVWIPPYIQTTKKTLLSFKSLIVAKVYLNSFTAGSGDFASQSDWHSVIFNEITILITWPKDNRRRIEMLKV